MSEAPELLPCPFCGTSGEAIETFKEGIWWRVACDQCGGMGTRRLAKPDAEWEWNRRSTPIAAGSGEATKDSLHSCVCLLEVMADSAKERGDDVEWAMMSVMAKNGREVLDGYHPE